MAKTNTKTIEQKVADAVLQRAVDEIDIGGVVYPIASPSIGTLIAVSDIVSTLPVVEKVPSPQVVSSVLYHARNFKGLGKIASTLILGAKPIYEERVTTDTRKSFLRLWKRPRKRVVKVCLQDELAQAIIDNVSPSVLFDVVVQRLKDMEIGSFFAITTSLSEANILKPTMEVD